MYQSRLAKIKYNKRPVEPFGIQKEVQKFCDNNTSEYHYEINEDLLLVAIANKLAIILE